MPKFSILTFIDTKKTHALQRISDSVKAQSFSDYEHIVVNEANPSFERIRQEVSAACGKYIIFLDDQHFLFPHALASIDQTLGNAENTPAVFSDVYSAGKKLGAETFYGKSDSLQWCLRRSLVLEVGRPWVGDNGCYEITPVHNPTVLGINDYPCDEDIPYGPSSVLYGVSRNWDACYPFMLFENGRFYGGPDSGDGRFTLADGYLSLYWDNWPVSHFHRVGDAYYCGDHEAFLSPKLQAQRIIKQPSIIQQITEFCGRHKIDAGKFSTLLREDDIGGREGTHDDSRVHRIEGQFLYALVRTYRPQLVVEFGTRFGCSTEHILRAMDRNDAGNIVSVDINPCIKIKSPRLEVVKWDGKAFSRDWTRGAIGLLFEDGPHTFDFTYSVVSNLLPYAERVLVHDVAHYTCTQQVSGGLLAAAGQFDSILLSACGYGYVDRTK